jgi:hypothetical protein
MQIEAKTKLTEAEAAMS